MLNICFHKKIKHNTDKIYIEIELAIIVRMGQIQTNKSILIGKIKENLKVILKWKSEKFLLMKLKLEGHVVPHTGKKKKTILEIENHVCASDFCLQLFWGVLEWQKEFRHLHCLSLTPGSTTGIVHSSQNAARID